MNISTLPLAIYSPLMLGAAIPAFLAVLACYFILAVRGVK